MTAPVSMAPNSATKFTTAPTSAMRLAVSTVNIPPLQYSPLDNNCTEKVDFHLNFEFIICTNDSFNLVIDLIIVRSLFTYCFKHLNELHSEEAV